MIYLFIQLTGPVFLKLGSAEPRGAIKDIKGSARRKFSGERFLLEVIYSYVRIQIRVASFEANHSDTDSTQSISASILKLADAVVKSLSRDRHITESIC